MNGDLQSLSPVQVLRQFISRIFDEVVFATHAVPVGQSADALQVCVQYVMPIVGPPSTPPQTGQPVQLGTGTPSGGGGPPPSSPSTSAVEASPLGCAELLSEQPICTIAQSDANATRPPKPQPKGAFFQVITIPIS
jgi:hypothetical protein